MRVGTTYKQQCDEFIAADKRFSIAQEAFLNRLSKRISEIIGFAVKANVQGSITLPKTDAHAEYVIYRDFRVINVDIYVSMSYLPKLKNFSPLHAPSSVVVRDKVVRIYESGVFDRFDEIYREEEERYIE